MKRFFLVTLGAISLLTTQTVTAIHKTRLTDDADSFAKGSSALYDLLDYQFIVSSNLQVTGGASTIIQKVQTFTTTHQDTMSSIGFVAANPTYKDNTTIPNIFNQILYTQNFIDVFTNNFNNIVTVNQNCTDNYKFFNSTIRNAFTSLANYSSNNTDGNKAAFIKLCNDSSCHKALTWLLAAVNGDSHAFGCDLTELIYNGAPNKTFYKGHRDVDIAMVASLYYQSVLGLTVVSAFETLNRSDNAYWTTVQQTYGQQLRQFLDRIYSLNTYLKQSELANAQYNLNYLSYNATAPQSNADMNVIAKSMLEKVFPLRKWFVGTYNGNSNAFWSYLHCQDCIQVVDYKNRYNIFAIGVATGVTANQQLLLSSTWQNLLTQYSTNAFTQAYTIGQQYCFKGLLSLVGEHSLAYSFPDSTYYNMIVNGGNTVVAFATNEPCRNGPVTTTIEEEVKSKFLQQEKVRKITEGIQSNFFTLFKQTSLKKIQDTFCSYANDYQFISSLVSCDQIGSSSNDIDDYVTKSMARLQAITSLTSQIHTIDVTLKNTSDTLLPSVQNWYSALNYSGSTGFAYTYQDLLDGLSSAQNEVYTTYSTLGDKQAEYQNYIYTVLYDKKLACNETLYNAASQLYSAYGVLRNFFIYQYIGNPVALKSLFLDACDEGVCDDALRTILSTLNGDFGRAGCDVLDEIYKGDLTKNLFYQGYRDLTTNTATHILDYALVGLSLQSGYYSMLNNNTEGWKISQSQYLKQLQTAINRVFIYDQLAKDNALWNAKRNLQSYLYLTVKDDWTTANVSNNSQALLSNLFPNHYWFVYTYTNVQGSDLHSWACSQCFATLNVRNKYHVLVAGIPRSSVANTDLVNNATLATDINNYSTANNLTSTWYNNNCLSGVFATIPGVDGAYAGDSDFAGIKLLQGTNTQKANVAIWAIQGTCPHTDIVTIIKKDVEMIKTDTQ